MSDFLVRGIPTPLLDKLGEQAKKLGVSRQVYVASLLTEHALSLGEQNTELLIGQLNEWQAKATLLRVAFGRNIHEVLQELALDKRANL